MPPAFGSGFSLAKTAVVTSGDCTPDGAAPPPQARPKPAPGPDLFDYVPPDAGERSYALAALANAADNVRTAPVGTRNGTLNSEARPYWYANGYPHEVQL